MKFVSRNNWINYRCNCCDKCCRIGSDIDYSRFRYLHRLFLLIGLIAAVGFILMHLLKSDQTMLCSFCLGTGISFPALLIWPWRVAKYEQRKTPEFLGPYWNSYFAQECGITRWGVVPRLVVSRNLFPDEPFAQLYPPLNSANVLDNYYGE
ncbi:MAG: hypothetical protein R3B84_17280 [Zavarzinella sp.]